MTPVRAWQRSTPTAGGMQRTSYVEIDVAHTGLRVEYVPNTVDGRTARMAHHAGFMSVFGPQAPTARGVLVVSRADCDEPFSARYPGLEPPGYRGATVVSADAGELAIVFAALESGLLEIRDRRPQVVTGEDAPALATVLATLWADQRVFFHPPGKTDFRVSQPPADRIDLLFPLSASGGLASRTVATLRPAVAFNGGYFLWIEDETRDPFSFALEPVGLTIHGGQVMSAPIYRRPAVLVFDTLYGLREDEARYSLGAPRIVIRELSLANLSLRLGDSVMICGPECVADRLPSDHRLPLTVAHVAEVNPAEPPGAAAFYTRLRGGAGAATQAETPSAPDRLECIVTGRQVMAVKRGGGTYIPMNGFVLSVAGALATAVETALAEGRHRLRYALDTGDGVAPVAGVQVGPRLVEAGRPLDVAQRIARGDEEYAPRAPEHGDEGVPPVYLTVDRQLHEPIARIGLGTRPDGRCYVAVVEGCEPRTTFPALDSEGATLQQLATTLVELGCTEVVQLDGGGSASLFVDGRPIVKTADRNDVPFMAAERAIPGAWCVWLDRAQLEGRT